MVIDAEKHTKLKYDLHGAIEALRSAGYRIISGDGEIIGWHERDVQGFTMDLDNHP